MFTYKQYTGTMTRNGETVGQGYSGHSVGLNKPMSQHVPRMGPIPQGLWKIGPAETHPHLGPLAMPLTPQRGTNTWNRDGFFIHGDNSKGNQSASEGCIIMPPDTRKLIAESGDTVLEVVA